MNILYCGDKNITDGLIMSVLSLKSNVRESLCVYILTAGFEYEGKVYEPIDRDLVDRLDRELKGANPESAVRLFDASELFIRELPIANLGTRFTPCCMLRLYADLLSEIPDRVLYLDNDVICLKNPADFYYTDMKDAGIAGVPDYYGSRFFSGGIFSGNYLNSGVLLLDMEKIRKNGIFVKCRERCRTKKMFMPDQTAINKLIRAKIKLPRRYNEQRREHADTVFRHFTTTFRFFPRIKTVTVKPWDIERMHGVLGNYRYDGLYEEYLYFKKKYEI